MWSVLHEEDLGTLSVQSYLYLKHASSKHSWSIKRFTVWESAQFIRFESAFWSKPIECLFSRFHFWTVEVWNEPPKRVVQVEELCTFMKRLASVYLSSICGMFIERWHFRLLSMGIRWHSFYLDCCYIFMHTFIFLHCFCCSNVAIFIVLLWIDFTFSTRNV